MNTRIISKVLLAAMSVSMLSFGAISSNTSAHTTLSATNAPGINATMETTASTGATVNASTTAAPTGSPADVVITQSPNPGNIWFDESRKRTSGQYTYHVLSEEQKLITILKVKDPGEKVVFPKELDGYKVIGIGKSYSLPYDMNFIEANYEYESLNITKSEDYYIFGDKQGMVKEITIPKDVRFIGVEAFGSCSALQKLKFLKGKREISIRERAFGLCTSLKSIIIPSNMNIVDLAFENCGKIKLVKVFGSISSCIAFRKTDIHTMVFNSATHFDTFPVIDNKTDVLIVGKKIKDFRWNYDTTDESHEKLLSFETKSTIKKMIVVNKNTKISGGYWDKYRPKYLSIGKLYTVKGAKAIKWAKKNKIKYKVVSKAKIKKLCKG